METTIFHLYLIVYSFAPYRFLALGANLAVYQLDWVWWYAMNKSRLKRANTRTYSDFYFVSWKAWRSRALGLLEYGV